MQSNLPNAHTELVTKLQLKLVSMKFYPYCLLGPCPQFLPGQSTLLPYAAAECSFKNPS